eukprot:750873_1
MPNLRASATTTLKQFMGDRLLLDNDIEQMLFIIKQPQVPKHLEDTPMKKLQQKSEAILIKHNKLKNNSKFRFRENMGELAELQHDIGRDLNNLTLKGIKQDEINSLTREWACINLKVKNINADIDKESDGIMKFKVKEFCKKIDADNKRKKELLSTQTGKKRKRTIMKDKTNSNSDNKNKTKTQISNNKSHLMRQKYSQLIDFDIYLNEQYNELSRKKTELERITKSFGIINNQNKCQ